MGAPGHFDQEKAERARIAAHVERAEPLLFTLAGRLADVAGRVSRARELTSPTCPARRRVDELDARLRALHRRIRVGEVTRDEAIAEAESIDAEARALRRGHRP